MAALTRSGSLGKCELSLTVNGELKTVSVYPMERLLDVLRYQLRLTGSKEGCGEGECGSCSVLMDGALVNSCLFPALQAEGANIRTIEGVAAGDVDLDSDDSTVDALQDGTANSCEHVDPPSRRGERSSGGAGSRRTALKEGRDRDPDGRSDHTRAV